MAGREQRTERACREILKVKKEKALLLADNCQRPGKQEITD